MKLLLTLLSACQLVGAALAQTTYTGNGGTGFGGYLGNATLAIDETATDITFALTPSAGVLPQGIIVLYLDSKAGGLTSTVNLIDVGDEFRVATSGDDPDTDQRALITFPNGFAPDYAIAFRESGVRVLQLTENGSHVLLHSAVPTQPVI